MTARVQGDTVKLKMVVDCDRLVSGLGGDAEKGSFLCLKRPPGFWRLSKSLQLFRSEAVFFNIRIPFL